MTFHSPPPADLHEPPAPTRAVMIVGLVGIGLAAFAFMLGVVSGAPRRGFEPHWLDGHRALFAIVGLFVAGCAVSMRPGWFGGWLCAAGAALLGYGVGRPPPDGTGWYLAPPRDWYSGVPNAWDSVQLFFGVACAVGLVGAIWTRLPRWGLATLTLVGVAYHFAGILSAVTSPPPTPWLTDQYWKRIARPYLQFAYMNNAYQFYSPDPGPACELWVCVEYKPIGSGDDPLVEGRECEWHFLPRRQDHYVDPFGLSFYRRLSLTENVSQYHAPGYVPLIAEQDKVLRRREAETGRIPRMGWPVDQERRTPNDLVTYQVLPAFARYLARAFPKPEMEVKSVKIYRVLHLITTLPQYRGYDSISGTRIPAVDPYNPSLFLPFYQGEYDPQGKLMDPTDPLLYWLVPITWDRPMPETVGEYRRNGFSQYFTDNVSKHAGCPRPIKEWNP
jgi:hypothetical protein